MSLKFLDFCIWHVVPIGARKLERAIDGEGNFIWLNLCRSDQLCYLFLVFPFSSSAVSHITLAVLFWTTMTTSLSGFLSFISIPAQNNHTNTQWSPISSSKFISDFFIACQTMFKLLPMSKVRTVMTWNCCVLRLVSCHNAFPVPSGKSPVSTLTNRLTPLCLKQCEFIFSLPAILKLIIEMSAGLILRGCFETGTRFYDLLLFFVGCQESLAFIRLKLHKVHFCLSLLRCL